MVTGGRARGGSFRRSVPNRPRSIQRPLPLSGINYWDVLGGIDTGLGYLEQLGGLRQDQESIVPDHLVPIGDTGLYATPNEAVDPTDCDRYPNSPFCGNLPIDPLEAATLEPISVSPFVAFNRDLSEGCISLSPNLFAVPLAPLEFCYRAPWARPLEPPQRPRGLSGDQPFYPLTPPRDLPGGLECFYSIGIAQPTAGAPPEPDPNDPGYYSGNIYYWTQGGLRGVPIGYSYRKVNPSLPLEYWNSELLIITQTTAQYSANPGNVIYTGVQPFPGRGSNDFLTPTGNIQFTSCPPGSRTPYRPTFVPVPPMPVYPTPPEPPMPCDCDRIEELLQLIAKRLGTSDYPVSVPEFLTESRSATKKQESLTQLLFWKIQQLDALFGQFPIPIEIEDIDPSREGNQTERIELPNLAEAVAEMYGLAVKTSVNSDLSINFLMRLASEAMATKNSSIVTQDYVKAVSQFLGYKGNPVDRKVQYAFDPEQTDNIEKILKESEKKVIGWRNEDPETVVDFLQKIVFSAGIIKAVFFRKPSQMGDMLNQIRSLTNPSSEENQAQEESWREFLQELNNPQSLLNRDFPIKPEVDNLGGG